MSNSLKAALWTALFTFIGTVLAALLPLLAAVENVVNGSDPTLIDDLSIFAKVVVSAAVAGVSGLVNWGVRAAQVRGAIPGETPDYSDLS